MNRDAFSGGAVAILLVMLLFEGCSKRSDANGAAGASATGATPGGTYAPGKSANELISASDLAAIMGFPFKDGQVQPMPDVIDTVKLPDLVKSSSVFFDSDQSAASKFNYGIQISVGELSNSDSSAVYEIVSDAIKDAIYTTPDRVPDMPGDCLRFAHSGESRMCIFKDEPNGCVALMICIRGAISAEAKAHPYSHAYDQKVLDKETQIALKIIGAPPQVPGVANDQVLADKDALKGLKEVSVEVDETGDQVPGFPDDTELRSTLLKQLSDAGIHVLPPSGKTTTSATLRLNVDTLSYTLGSPPYTTFGIYSARLQFIQLFPAIDPSQSGKSVQAITWTSGNLGIKGGFMVNQVAQEIAGLDSDFVTAYQKANGIAPPQQ